MSYQFKQLINGKFCDSLSGKTREQINPATEEVISTLPYGNADDCRAAIDAAAAAFPAWSRATAYERAAVLMRVAALIRADADELAKITILESGKPWLQARGEWLVGADLFEWFAEEGKRAYGRTIPSRNPARRLIVIRQALGVVGVITAWNFPIYNVARATAAALAAGCTVVIRPSEYTPMTAIALGNIFVEAGGPAGVLNVLHGTASAMGAEMLANPKLAKIHLTGSPQVGRILMDGASKTMTRLSLELGGNAPVLVFPDVDLDALAASAVVAKFRNAGQVCVAPQRFIVHESIAADFAERVANLSSQLKIGSGLDQSVQLGPLINQKQRESVEALMAKAVAAGANVLTGGKRPASQPRGFFYEPTVVTGVKEGSPLSEEEIFGPVLPVMTFKDTEEALRIANSTHHGLASFVWTNNLRIARECAERLEFGLVGLNDWNPHATEGPFTGWKESGVGRESGAEGLDEYLETKQISIGI